MIELRSGEFYWLCREGCSPFIAEYQAENRDRNGAKAGPCFWSGVQEVQLDGVEVLGHVPKPGLPKTADRDAAIIAWGVIAGAVIVYGTIAFVVAHFVLKFW